jgi:hypothetical protein
MHIFFDPRVLDECREKIPSWIGDATESVMHTLSVQRMLATRVQEIMDRIDQDNRLAIPAVVPTDDILMSEESDSNVQFLLPLSAVDPTLKGVYLVARRRGGFYRAHRLIGSAEAYSLARPIRKNLFDKEWWTIF